MLTLYIYIEPADPFSQATWLCWGNVSGLSWGLCFIFTRVDTLNLLKSSVSFLDHRSISWPRCRGNGRSLSFVPQGRKKSDGQLGKISPSIHHHCIFTAWISHVRHMRVHIPFLCFSQCYVMWWCVPSLRTRRWCFPVRAPYHCAK